MVCDTLVKREDGILLCSLNPYSIGIWSATLLLYKRKNIYKLVLILILLEYGLRRVPPRPLP